ncbi:MAG: Ppx/GppA family phosphatase [Balneola sp.]
MKAAIDIGTNTALLLIAEITDGGVQVLREEQRIPRLGQGVDESKMLHPDSMNRVLQNLKEYKTIVQEYPAVKQVVVTATSAVRDAGNREHFISKIKEETGFEVRLLSGDEEAQYTFQGALTEVTISEGHSAFVLDIGGGSTELAYGSTDSLSQYHSFDMGSVRFKERFLTNNPPKPDEIEACKNEINRLLNRKKFEIHPNATAIGVAGTATSLAAIILNLKEYDMSLINGFAITLAALSEVVIFLSSKTYDEILRVCPKILKGREDILLPGLLIMESFMKFYELEEIKVSTGGIRHGAILLSEKD